ncbi:cubilin [Trichonephila clavipes]|nr:cubilin [Trichonephila clavipes]
MIKRKWHLTATGKSFSCSRTYDQKEFFLRSPDYPGNYSHDANCTYRIIRHSKRVCAIKVTFATFHLEESVNCKNDFFSVDDRKFCGSLEDATTRELTLSHIHIGGYGSFPLSG